MKLLLFCFLSVSISLSAQTNCDSLIINCCDYSLIGNDTITLQVQNTATQEIFDYPGFVILDQAGDTIAKETVNYFGIGGGGFQTHTLNLMAPLVVPFQGTLQLHGLFYDTLYCEFPLIINSLSLEKMANSLSTYPNPVHDKLFVDGIESGSYRLYSLTGELVGYDSFQKQGISLATLKAGMYVIEVEDNANGQITRVKILKD